MNRIIGAVVATAVLAAGTPAWAIEYTPDGHVIPGSGSGEAQLLASDIAVGVAIPAVLVSGVVIYELSMIAPLVASMGGLFYGAWRTNKYRSPERKAQIRAALANRKAQPVPGTVSSLQLSGLGW